MGVPYQTFRCEIARLEALIVASAGGAAYTADDGVQLVGVNFSADTTVARKTLTLSQFAAGTTSAQLATLITNESGTGLVVFNTGPSLDAPKIINGIVDSFGNKILDFAQVASAVNNVIVTNAATGQPATITASSSVDTNVNLLLAGQGTGTVQYKSLEIGFRAVPSNSQTAAYTTVLEDGGKCIDHPVSDNNARAFTIDGSLAYPIGTCITFCNMAATACTIPITTDTMYLAGTGTTGTRTLAQYGVATARKHAAGVWLISGVGLT
jgi:hypothetical protein